MQEVLTVSPAVFKRMSLAYPTNTNLPTGAAFRMKGSRVTVTGYSKSKKVMFQGQAAKEEAARWGHQESSSATSHSPSGLPDGFSSWSVLGSDEVGTGSYFGPLTVAAVFVSAKQVDKISRLGVRDSKTLTDPEIIKLAKKITASCPYHIVNLNPEIYNHKITGRSQAALKALCHNLALSRVLQKIKPVLPDAILIDQFEQPQTYYRQLRGQATVVSKNVYFRIKGEQAHVAVAAASVVARAYSLKVMDQLSEEAGITLPIGAGHLVDETAAKLLRRGQPLGHFAKLHFANTTKAKRLAAD